MDLPDVASSTSTTSSTLASYNNPLTELQDLRDAKYLDRRRKNNEAARRSREKRRMNDQALEFKLDSLERENGVLKEEVKRLRLLVQTLVSGGTPQQQLTPDTECHSRAHGTSTMDSSVFLGSLPTPPVPTSPLANAPPQPLVITARNSVSTPNPTSRLISLENPQIITIGHQDYLIANPTSNLVSLVSSSPQQQHTPQLRVLTQLDSSHPREVTSKTINIIKNTSAPNGATGRSNFLAPSVTIPQQQTVKRAPVPCIELDSDDKEADIKVKTEPQECLVPSTQLDEMPCSDFLNPALFVPSSSHMKVSVNRGSTLLHPEKVEMSTTERTPPVHEVSSAPSLVSNELRSEVDSLRAEVLELKSLLLHRN